ncbi:hypothetical protein [Vagococcus intermedius]|uniref:NADH:flavin oxidoreductase/NADH oxidase N-terminal domain-containing protein n=1 Tax=Vagococcus intermedius TaxID=2991418 RepID=A0AAF0CTX9_9ENTE|nr:hypothetical protein [Vagococcus intermedius]WEG72791.1 hypothetical protein OL234_07315 [Vagococcus intermedius]WEG74876.1 hypothetical protein OL235_07310 [Vagococcus intermedius]
MKVQEAYTLPSGLTLKNRLFFAPISTLSSSVSGQVTEEECDFYSARTGDVGAIVVASAYVSIKGKAYDNGLSISHKTCVKELTKLARVIQKGQTRAIIQIYHGGAMCAYRRNQKVSYCVSQDSERLLAVSDHEYQELTDDKIEMIFVEYEEALRRAIASGFDGVEIHASNNYLPYQFLMSGWNLRQDKWGGSLTNRFRFLGELIGRLQKIIEAETSGAFSLGVRLSVEDSGASGSQREESLRDTLLIIQLLNNCPIDYIHLATSDMLKEVEIDGVTLPLAKMLNKMSPSVPLIGCGNLLTAPSVEKVLNECQLASACRPYIFIPNWAEKVLNGEKISLDNVEMEPVMRRRLKIPWNLWQSVKESADWYLYR